MDENEAVIPELPPIPPIPPGLPPIPPFPLPLSSTNVPELNDFVPSQSKASLPFDTAIAPSIVIEPFESNPSWSPSAALT